MRSSHLLGNSRAGLVSSTVLLRIEFTATDASTPMRALLPHVSTLTSSAQTSYPSLRRKRQSSYIPLRLLCRQSRGFAGFWGRKNFISFALPQEAKLVHSILPPLPSKRGFAGFWGRKNFISFVLLQEAKLVHSILPPLPSKQGFAGFWEHAGNTPAVSCVGIWTRRYISVALFLRSLWAGVTRYPCPVEPGLSS